MSPDTYNSRSVALLRAVVHEPPFVAVLTKNCKVEKALFVVPFVPTKGDSYCAVQRKIEL